MTTKRAFRGPAQALIAAALLPLTLAACKHDEAGGPQVAGWTLIDPQQRHPIMVSQEPSTLSVRVPAGSQGLTLQQRADVVEFASKYRSSDAGNSRLVLSAPSGSANEMAAMAAVDDIRGILINAGFNEAAIAVEAYHSEGSGAAPVRVSYMRYVAEGPDCTGLAGQNLAGNYNNLPSPNFGCSYQRNIAAMVDNPADLLGPRSSSARFGPRRDAVYKKYVEGQTTGAERSADERVNTRAQQN